MLNEEATPAAEPRVETLEQEVARLRKRVRFLEVVIEADTLLRQRLRVAEDRERRRETN